MAILTISKAQLLKYNNLKNSQNNVLKMEYRKLLNNSQKYNPKQLIVFKLKHKRIIHLKFYKDLSNQKRGRRKQRG